MREKNKIFKKIADMLAELDFTIAGKDDSRPWGGFYVIDEAQALKFASVFFSEEKINDLKITERLSPKILLVSPHHRLSWQYHHRRAEIWKCIGPDVAVITSDTDEEKERRVLHNGDIIKLKQEKRHRLVGLEDWGLVAEIWQHTDAANPSDEEDIVRLQDDYNRK